jgi:hypothetical protein
LQILNSYTCKHHYSNTNVHYMKSIKRNGKYVKYIFKYIQKTKQYMHEINHSMYIFLYHISNIYTPILKYVLQLFTTTKKFRDEFLIKMNHNHNISSSHTLGELSTTQVRSRASCCLLGRCTASKTIASASISAMKAASEASRLYRSSGDMSNRRPPLWSLGSIEYFFSGGPSQTTLAYILYASPSSFSESWTGKST